MFINRTTDGRNNIAGIKVTELRKNLRISQRELSDRLNVIGLDIDKNAVQRMESGQRFITDIELGYLAKVFGVTIEELLGRSSQCHQQQKLSGTRDTAVLRAHRAFQQRHQGAFREDRARNHQEPEKQGSGDNDRAKHSGLECSAREHGDSLRSMGAEHCRPGTQI